MRERHSRSGWIAAGILVLLLGMVWGTWTYDSRVRRERRRLILGTTVSRDCLRLKEFFDVRMHTLDQLARLWESVSDHSPERFCRLSLAMQAEFPGFQAINWVDPSGVIRIVCPVEGNEAALDLDLKNHPQAGPAIRRARDERRVAVTHALQLAQGGWGFTAYRPVSKQDGGLEGFINGVFRLHPILEECLDPPILGNKEFSYRFSQHGRLILEIGRMLSDDEWQDAQTRTYTFAGHPWTLAITVPGDSELGLETTPPRSLLIVGIILAVSISAMALAVLRRGEQARRRRAESKRILDMTQDGVWVLGPDGETRFANERIAEILGVSGDELARHSFGDFLPDGVDADVANLAPDSDVKLVRASGEEVWCRIAATPMPEGDAELGGTLLMVTDVGQRRELERQLHRAQRMEMVGRFAGGIAHDFNNVLTAIVGATDILDDELPHDSPSRAMVETIRDSSERAMRLTSQLLAISRRQFVEPEKVRPDTILRDMEPMLARIVNETVRLVFHSSNRLAVEVDVAQFEQVVLNLVVNACDAMPHGGTITLSLRDLVLEQPGRLGCEIVPAGKWVVLEVEDEGVGMDEETLEKVFEPFFTTKIAGGGTGLGLSTVHGIVTQAGGLLAAESAPGQGAVFFIAFPGKTIADDSKVEEGRSAPEESGGEEPIRLLLVEDNDSVRTALALSLRDAGITVRTASSVGEARDALAEPSLSIDVLVTDVVMPDGGGQEVARIAGELAPGLPVLFISGYAAADGDLVAPRDVPWAILPKPFSRRTLLSRLRSLIREAKTLRDARALDGERD
ncbi:MAG TPA: response regulator [Planctomycetes bacterium]|nr:response regulator [Planctomycetota bacterium]